VSEAAPIIRIEDTLLVSLQGDLDDTSVIAIEDQLTKEVVRTHVTGILIDVSGLSVIDSFSARVIACWARRRPSWGSSRRWRSRW
jgi:rsbT antagonist protein RsbS